MKTLTNLSILLVGFFLQNSISLADSQEEDFEQAPPTNDNGNDDSDFDPGIRIKSYSLEGTGCPESGTSSVLSPDKRTLSVLFSDFRVESLKRTREREQKKCKLRIDFVVPPGIAASITRLDLRGFYSLPQGAKAIVKTEFDLPQTGKFYLGPLVRKKVFAGPKQEDFFISSRLRNFQPKFDCGKDFSLKSDLILNLSNPIGRQSAEATLDTLDLRQNQKVTFHLRWKKCKDLKRDKFGR